MVHPSIILAHSAIKASRMNTFNSYDSDYHDESITETVQTELRRLHINLSVLPSVLEEELLEAIEEEAVSANIDAARQDDDYERTMRSLRWA